jgi:hypothetical protein
MFARLTTLMASVACAMAEVSQHTEQNDFTKMQVEVIDTSCSGFGVYREDRERCECHECRKGVLCQLEREHCALTHISIGQPYLFDQYWQRHATELEEFKTEITMDYRVSYEIPGLLPPPVSFKTSITKTPTIVVITELTCWYFERVVFCLDRSRSRTKSG